MDHARDLPPPQAVNAEEVRLLRAAVESGLDGMVVVSPEGRMVAFNHQFVQMWPIPAEVVASGSDEAALQSVLDKVVDPDGFLSRVHEYYADPTESSRDVLHLVTGASSTATALRCTTATGPTSGGPGTSATSPSSTSRRRRARSR